MSSLTTPATTPSTIPPSPIGPTELVAAAAPILDRLAEAQGVEAARLAALGFLAGYFKDEGQPADVVELRAQLATQAGELAELRTALALARTAVERAEGEALLRRVRREAADANAPVPEADLARVQTLLDRRDLDMARALADALLGRSRAEHQTAYRRGARARLEETHDPKKDATEVQARALKSRGWTVELSADGTEILRAERPEGA